MNAWSRRSISALENATPSFTGAGSSRPRLGGASLSTAFGAGVSGQSESDITGGAPQAARNRMNAKLTSDL